MCVRVCACACVCASVHVRVLEIIKLETYVWLVQAMTLVLIQ